MSDLLTSSKPHGTKLKVMNKRTGETEEGVVTQNGVVRATTRRRHRPAFSEGAYKILREEDE